MTTEPQASPYLFTPPATRVGVYGWVTGTGGVSHYRVLEPLRVLGEHGNRVDHGRILSNEILETVDTVLVHMPHGESDLEALEQLARNNSHRVVVDVDDAMWWPDYQPFREHWTDENLRRLNRAIEIAHVVTTPAPMIASYVHRFNKNVWVVPNTVPEWVLTHDMPARTAPTVGWQISSSHIPNWRRSVIDNIERFMQRHPDWRVHSYGPTINLEGDSPRIQRTPWTTSVSEYYRHLSLDVGIGPLRDSPFNRAKSSLRAIEYMALGIVPVLPDLPIYHGWVDNGVNGRLIESHETLAGVLHEVAPGHVRSEMAQQARWAAAAWTTERNIERWIQAWVSR